MKIKINNLKKRIGIGFLIILLLILLLFYCDYIKNSIFVTLITVIITVLSTMEVALFNYLFKLIDQYTGVRPIWKFPSFPFEIEFYTLNGDQTVADYIEYYLIDLKHGKKEFTSLIIFLVIL